jgi:hypothetical protein
MAFPLVGKAINRDRGAGPDARVMARAVRSDGQNDVSILVYFGENDKFEFIGGRRSQHQAAEDVQTGKGRMPHVLTKYEIYG